MGYKNVCLRCRKAFNQGTDYNNIKESICPECGEKMHQVNHKFKPPKKDNLKKWEVVSFLFESGFIYQHIYINKNEYAIYPQTLSEAKSFVIQYKSQAYKL